MNIDAINEAAEKILDKITVGVHHPQFREAVITCMKEFAEWRLEQFKAEQKQSAVMIKCPSCDYVQAAIIEHSVPFNTYIHHCEKCEYIIMESEWDEVKAFELTPQKQLSNEDDLVCLLEDLEDYFDDISDADYDYETGKNIPNKEMRFLSRIQKIRLK